jgi:hypothetical protein
MVTRTLNILSVSNRLDSFWIGGFSVLLVALVSFLKSYSLIGLSQLHGVIYYLGIFLAVFIYQPHFVATYTLAYSRKISKHKVVLLFLPVMLTLFFLYVFITELILNTSPYVSLLNVALIITLLGAIYHFSLQAYGVLSYYLQLKLGHVESIFVKLVFIFSSLYGLLNFIHLKNGFFDFFSLSLSINLNLEVALNVFFYLIILMYFITLYVIYKKKAGFNSYVVLLAFSLWYLNDYFVSQYFYLIPLFHSLQFIPFFYKKNRNTPGKTLKSILIVAISFVVIFLIPNLIDSYVLGIPGTSSSYIFVCVLICVNLHHFAMESIIWRK